MGAPAHSHFLSVHCGMACACAVIGKEEMTTSAYAPLTVAQQIFKDLIWTPMIQAGETYIEAEVPALALPVVKQLDEYTINAVTDYAFNALMLVIDVEVIKLVNSAHQSAYDSASVQLLIVAQEKGITSDEFIKARDAAALALSAFTRFGQ